MSIRPVDLQVMIPRTAELNRVQTNEGRPEAVQHFAQQFQKEVVHSQSSVVSANNSEEVSKDGRGNGAGKRDQKPKSKQDERPKTGPDAPEGGSMIDISV